MTSLLVRGARSVLGLSTARPLLAAGAVPVRQQERALSIKGRKEAIKWYKEELARLEDFRLCARKFQAPIVTTKLGRELLKEPLLNKGTAFKTAERDSMQLRGLVPPRRLRMNDQCRKVMAQIRGAEDPLKKNLILQGVQDRNEVLYYRLLQDNIQELAPIVYTPTVGAVCQKFGSNFSQARGMYFSGMDRGHMASMMYNWPENDVEVIVVTDGSRILGLGDLGTNGMGIPVGKLALYVAAGGIDPQKVLPVMLDTGTNNAELQEDEFYLGLQHPRLQGEAYYSLVDEFMQAAAHRWPNALVQFEDFSSDHAAPLLEKYMRSQLCFNDDIQGTGATTVAGVLSALRAIGQSLSEQRVMVVGAGSAGTGVAVTLLQAMIGEGLESDDAAERFVMVDQYGLLGAGREGLDMHQALFQTHTMNDTMPLEDVVDAFKPTILLGLSGCAGLFTERAITSMASSCERPIIFPLSNPTSNAECTAEQAIRWTEGRAIFASGSPFEPVEYGGRTISTSQCNNMFIFPGLGLGAVLCEAEIVTGQMLQASSLALANALTDDERASGMTFPSVERIRDVSAEVAAGVMLQAAREGVSRMDSRKFDLREGRRKPEDVVAFALKNMWEAKYSPLCPPALDFTPSSR
jgi:malate dehydrogenase (oxaloacetate-decarboxylating)(NADP+)